MSRLMEEGRCQSYASIPSDIAPEEVEVSIKDEFEHIGKNAVPLIVTFALQISLSFVTVAFVGRLGALELGGVSLANVTFTATSAVFQGLATCLDTLCPQAFGAKQYQLVGLYFQRGLAISLMFACPIALLWWNSRLMLSAMVDDQRLVEIAARYLRIMVTSIPGYVMFECGKKYMQAQNDFTTAQYILFVCAPFNVLLNYLFVFRFGLGFIGAPIATSLTFTLMGVSLATFIWRKTYTDGSASCWSPFKNWKSIFSNWGTMISLAIPGIIMIEAEFLAFESLTILSAKFGTESLAAQSVIASIQSLTFQAPFSAGIAASNRIAYHIGKSRVRACQVASQATLLYIGFLIGTTNLLFLVLGRNIIPSVFSNDKNVVKIASQVLPIIGINQVCDVLNVLSAGILRAQGRQKIGGVLNIIAYYLVGLPMAVFLGFRCKWALQGFWVGLGCGILFLGLSELYCVLKSDWTKIIRNSQLLHKDAPVM
ncbi:LAQU0S03e05842g1_1 [Lachancea quebecensis]|uniref:LAQU0S03e05842g1_1 n=1 Tax=Lachancea quebecensis TaxID=1654605 RepID=A0A0P1KP88_9SACH|nr:LAQU0S03e05842g1_1 [Lachancea quebecensis]